MQSKAELEQKISDLSAEYEAKLLGFADVVKAEMVQQRALVDLLNAKILQLQQQPNVPVDFSVDLGRLYAGLDTLDELSASVSKIVADEPAVVDSNPVVE